MRGFFKAKSFNWLPVLVTFLVTFGLLLLINPGKIAADTKLDLMFNPTGFLAGAANIWNSNLTLGQLQNQAYGYFFPQGLFFSFFHWVNLPIWIVQRLWWSLILTIGWGGIVRLVQILRVANFWAAFLGGIAFICSPQIWGSLTSISSEVWPLVLAPWLLYLTIKVVNYRPLITESSLTMQRTTRYLLVNSLAFAGIVFCLGAINAIATLVAGLPAFLWGSYFFIKADSPARKYLGKFFFFTGLFSGLACVWWIVPLFILGKYSPSFLDYIESAQVTNRWNSLGEVLRGTTNWTYFISDNSLVGNFFVTDWAAIVVTGLLFILGLVGFNFLNREFRKPIFLIFMVGVIIFSLGFTGWASSPLNHFWLTALDGPLSPLRNVHKFDGLLRIPLAIGVAALLAESDLLADRELLANKMTHWVTKMTNPVWLLTMFSLLGILLVPTANGLATRNAFSGIPSYWQQTATWLADHTKLPNSPYHTRTLLLPGAPFGDQTWGFTRDEPLQPFAQSPWAVRDSIPLTPPAAIRMLDSVQNNLVKGIPNDRLADFLRGQGFAYIVLRADLHLATARTVSVLPILQALQNSQHIVKVAEFGPRVKQSHLKNTVYGLGVEDYQPAVQIFALQGTVPTNRPYAVNLAAVPKVVGAAEATFPLQTAPTPSASFANLPVVYVNPSQIPPSLPPAPWVITDTPKYREVDFGKVYANRSGIRGRVDPRTTLNRLPDYQTDNISPVERVWNTAAARVAVSSAADDATQLGNIVYSAGITAALDDDPQTAWVSGRLSGTVGQWIDFKFKHNYSKLQLFLVPGKTLGTQVSKVKIETKRGTILQEVRVGKETTVVLPPGATDWLRITAAETQNGGNGVQFSLAEVKLKDLVANRFLNLAPDFQLPSNQDQPPVQARVFTNEFLGSAACLKNKDYYACDRDLFSKTEAGNNFQRSFYSSRVERVIPQLWVQPNFMAIHDYFANLSKPSGITVVGPAITNDVRGSTQALLDNDPSTIWQSPNLSNNGAVNGVQLIFHFQQPQLLTRMHFEWAHSKVMQFAAPQLIAVNAGQGRQVVKLSADGWANFRPIRAENLRVNILRWEPKYSLDSFGDKKLVGPALAGITFYTGQQALPKVLSPQGDTIFTLPCGMGPQVTVNGRRLQTRVKVSYRDLTTGRLVPADFCTIPTVGAPSSSESKLIEGNNQLTITNTRYFSPAIFKLSNPHWLSVVHPAIIPLQITNWNNSRRVLDLPKPVPTSQLLVVPESFNSGWQARMANGELLTPQVVNGWQQGWILPANYTGKLQIDFPANKFYRGSIAGGLVLGFCILCLAVILGRLWRVKRLEFHSYPVQPTKSSVAATRVAGGVAWGFSALIFYLTFNWVGLLIFLGSAAGFYKLAWLRRFYLRVLIIIALVGFLWLARNAWTVAPNYWKTVNYLQLLYITVLSFSWLRLWRSKLFRQSQEW